MKTNKKAQVFDSLASLAVGIATVTIIMVVAFIVMANVKTQAEDVSGVVCNATSGDLACNSTSTLQNAAATVPGWIPLVVIVAIGALILGMIGMFKR